MGREEGGGVGAVVEGKAKPEWKQSLSICATRAIDFISTCMRTLVFYQAKQTFNVQQGKITVVAISELVDKREIYYKSFNSIQSFFFIYAPFDVKCERRA